MVQTEQKHTYSNHESPTKSPIEHSQTTSEKLSSRLNNRTLKDFTQMLDPYKKIHWIPQSPLLTL